MGRTTKPLSDAEVRKAKSLEKMYKLFDGAGLYLEVKTNGRKVWRTDFRWEGKTKSYTIGDYPTVTLSSARITSQEVREDARNGIDPVQKRKGSEGSENAVSIQTFKQVGDEFMELKSYTYSLSHYMKQHGRLNNYVYPYIGSRDIREITKQDIIDLIKNVQKVETKTTRQTQKHETAKRVFQLISQIYQYAVHHDIVIDDIPRRIEFSSVIPRITPQKLKAIVELNGVRMMYGMLSEYQGDFTTRNALKFLALSALRPGNIRNMKWEYIDFQNDVVNFPGEAMKMKESYRLPLTSTLIQLIDEMKPLTRYHSEYVFCSPIAPSKPMSENTLNYAHKRIGIADHNAHGWRSSFSTLCYEKQKDHGFGAEVIESQLAHSLGNAVKTAYLRSDFIVERQLLLRWWEKLIT